MTRTGDAPRIPPWLRGLALVALVVAVYAPTLSNGYVSDDEIYVRGIEPLHTLAGLRDIWFRIGAVPQYYPLVHTSFWLEYQLWGLDPAGYHAMNLALHAVVVLLAWRLLARLRVPGAWLAAAVFAVHPVHVETVAWASERKNLYSATFALASILAYLRFAPLDAAEAPRPARFAVLALALYVAALLSKTVAVSTPAVLLVLRWWKTGRIAWRDVRPLLLFVAIGVPLALLTVWIERVHVGAQGGAWQLGTLDRVLVAGRAVWFYLGKLVWPHPLGFVYPRWTIDVHAPLQWAYPVALAALAGAFWVGRRISRGPLTALLLFVGVLFPALGFFDVYPFLFSFVADHYQYPASLAPIALAVAAATRTRMGRGAAAIAVGGAVVACLGILAHRETRAYRDDETLIRRNAFQQPDSWAAHYRLAAVLRDENRHADAIAELEEAARLYPEHALTHATIGVDQLALGRLDDAAAAFERALAGDLGDDDRAEIELRLGNLRVSQGRFEDAARAFRAGAALDPRSGELAYSLGVVLRQLGDRAGAIEALRRSIASEPAVAKSHFALGTVLLENGDAAGAVAELRRAVELGPRDADATNLLGVALARTGDTAGATAAFEQALAIDPAHAGAAANLRTTREGGR